MNTLSTSLRLGLEDLLGDLWHARGKGDLGRLLLLSYCEVRRWARLAGEPRLAERAAQLMTSCPHGDRDSFLDQVDILVRQLEQCLARDRLLHEDALTRPTAAPTPASQHVR